MRRYFNVGKKIFNLISKFIFVGSIILLIINVFFYFIQKDKPVYQTNGYEKVQKNLYTTLNDPKYQKDSAGKLRIGMYRSFLCAMIGEACTNNPKEADSHFDKSIVGNLTKLVVAPFSFPQASGTYWALNGLKNAGFIPKSYAAEGIGFAALEPFQKIWVVFRDLVFMIMVLIIVVIGFMIMFRSKINPQTVISIENALPKIVLTLIYITFSYAIAGFLIDLMYVSIGFIIVLLGPTLQQTSNITQPELFAKLFNENKTGWVTSFSLFPMDRLWTLSQSIYTLIGYEIKTILSLIVGFVVSQFVLNTKIIGGLVDKNTLGTLTLPGGIDFKIPILGYAISLGIISVITVLCMAIGLDLLLYLLLTFSVIFVIFRIFFMLLNVYLQTLLLIIFSPLILAMEAIPGKNVFSGWIKNLVVNLLTFPIVVALLLIGKIIMDLPTGQSDRLWTPPLLIFIQPDSFKVLVGAMLFFMLPDLVKTFKQLTGIKPLPIDMNLGSLLGGGQAVGGGAIGMLGQFGSISLGAQAILGPNNLFRTVLGRTGEDVNKKVKTGISGDKNQDG